MNTPQVIQWHTNERGNITALFFSRGRKFLRVIAMNGHGIKIQRVPFEEEQYFRPAEHRGKPYPVKRYVRGLLKASKKFGIRKSAEQVLREILK